MNSNSRATAVGVFVLIGLLCLAYMTIKLGNEITDTEPSIDLGSLISKYAFGEVKK